MKAKKKNQSYFIYECEICWYKNQYKPCVELCEKRHNCKHLNISYGFIEASNYYWFETKWISKKCSYCKEELWEKLFEDLKQEEIKQIYNSID